MTTFSFLPIEVAMDSRLSKNQIRVLIALFSFRSKNTDTVWPTRKALSERCGLALTKISTITTELVALGWLIKEGRGGYSKATRYQVTVPDLDKTATVTESVTVTDSVTVTESVTGSGYGNSNTQRTNHLNLYDHDHDSRARACVTETPPDSPQLKTVERDLPPRNLPENLNPKYVPEDSREWVEFFAQKTGINFAQNFSAKTYAGLLWFHQQKFSIEEAEAACQITDGPKNPYYYGKVIYSMRQHLARLKESPIELDTPSGPLFQQQGRKQHADSRPFSQPHYRSAAGRAEAAVLAYEQSQQPLEDYDSPGEFDVTFRSQRIR